MPETFDVQKRTFIQKPEVKICPACGQPITPDVKPMSNHMNSYIANTENAKPQIVNSNEESIILNGVTVYKINPVTKKATFPVKASIPSQATAVPVAKSTVLTPAAP